MGHRHTSEEFGGAGGVRAAGGGTGAAAALDFEQRPELRPEQRAERNSEPPSKQHSEQCSETGAEHGAEGMSVPARALLFAVRVYQAFFSGMMPSACKFYPSCSHYASDAIRIHGARRGTWLALRRLSRCHPFTPGGVDLVPEKVAQALFTQSPCKGLPVRVSERMDIRETNNLEKRTAKSGCATVGHS
jgi:putative membrane protein insertion efficiency factor